MCRRPRAASGDVRFEVSRPGLTVRARRGYGARSGAQRASDVTERAVRPTVEYGGIPVTLRRAPARKEKKYCSLPISLTLPASSLTFTPQGEGSQAKADIFVGAMDDSGNTSDIGREEAVFNLPKGAPAQAA